MIGFDKCPFPWFGGKSKAAPLVWNLLGDPDHYVEPFAGSLAVLLLRPHLANRPYFSETVNDADGLLVNAWRAIQLSPDATAEHASNPVAEADLHARHLALVRWRAERQVGHLMGDPTWCDPQAAGWWLWGICSWIGGGWCNGSGPWITDDTGRLVKQSGTGVSRQRPHLGDNGRGVNHAGLREPGVWRQRPHLSNNGMGVNHPQLREPGTDDGEEFHPVTMPELRRWFAYLSARLRHVRILNGDFARCLTGGAAKTLPVRQGKGPCGVFLDPPYSHEVRDASLYTVESADAAVRAREWALAHGDDKQYRIVFAGFEGEHGDAFTDAGWTEHEWFAEGWLQGGMARTSKKDTHQQKRERLYASPHCWKQRDLFGGPT